MLDEALESIEQPEEEWEDLSEEIPEEVASNSARSSEDSSSTPSASASEHSQQDSQQGGSMEDLNAALESSMGGFDSMILREREYVRRQGRSAAAERDLEDAAAQAAAQATAADTLDQTGEYGGAGSPANSPEDSLENPAGGGTPPASSEEATIASANGYPPVPQRKGDYGNSGQAIPKDIPDGSDDDIVARQIREAALKEIDPALREKLWDEYRKYKGL